MDHVNKTLDLSLKQDINVLTETIENIEIDADVKSWMFPTKNFKFVKEFINANKVFTYGNTELYSELLVDRLYVGLRLILCQLEKVVENELVDDNSLIQSPRQITIGCCFLRLKKIVETIANKMMDGSHRTAINTKNPVIGRVLKHGKTQTDNITLDKCDSCASAITCMKNILDIFEESNNNMSIKK